MSSSSPWMILHSIILGVPLKFSISMTIVDHTSLVMAAPSSQKPIMTIIPSELTRMISLWPQPTRILWSRVALESERIRAQNSKPKITLPWLILLINSLQDRDWSQRHQMTSMRSVGWNLQMMKPTIHNSIRKEEVIYNNIKNNKIFIIKAIRIPIIIKALTGFNKKEPLQRLEQIFIMIAACSINIVRPNMTSSERRSKPPPKGIKRGPRRRQRYLQYLSVISIQTNSIKARYKQPNLKRTRTCSTTSTRRWKLETQGTWNLIKLNKLMHSNWFISQAGNNMMALVLTIALLTKDTSLYSKR